MSTSYLSLFRLNVNTPWRVQIFVSVQDEIEIGLGVSKVD